MNMMQASPTETQPGETQPGLAGKAALVTGGASGLGAAICRLLNQSGAHVAIADIQTEKASSLARTLQANGAKTHAMSCDIGNPEAAESAISEVVSEFGRIDILINNAGTDKTLSMSELTPEDWLRVIDTNLNGPFFLSKFASEHMKRQGSGHIVNISSTAAKRCWPNASAYHASKWGLLGLSHAMHAELRSHNIKVTGVVVGGMRTPFLLDRFPDIDVSKLQDPMDAARGVVSVLVQNSVIAEITILPMQETSWP